MSGEINTLHITEQDALFKGILCIGVDFLVKKNKFTAVDKKSMDYIARRQRRLANDIEIDFSDSTFKSRVSVHLQHQVLVSLQD